MRLAVRPHTPQEHRVSAEAFYGKQNENSFSVVSITDCSRWRLACMVAVREVNNTRDMTSQYTKTALAENSYLVLA